MRNKYKKIQIGIEVECILNREKLPFIERGGYHRGIRLINDKGKGVSGWNVESDSSIGCGDEFEDAVGTEFVSEVFKSKKDFFQGINRLIDTLSCNGKYKLKEVIEVDNSCGCHIHLSKGKRNFHNKVHSFIYEKAKKDFFKRIKNSTLPSKTKMSVLSQYYRRYATKSDKKQFEHNRKSGGRRVSEWNFNSEFDGRGLEWRSFNIMNVENWEDFRLLMAIGFDTVAYMLDALGGWKKGNLFRKEIEIKPETVKKRIIKTLKKRDKKVVLKIIRNRNTHIIIKKRKEKIEVKRKGKNSIIVRKKLSDRLMRILESGEYL